MTINEAIDRLKLDKCSCATGSNPISCSYRNCNYRKNMIDTIVNYVNEHEHIIINNRLDF